jgi:hypothetical protein
MIKCRELVIGAGVALLVTAFPASAAAQTDYYNTDAGRPITVEDASATERYAFELQLAPVRLERGRAGRYRWGVEPEIAYGILPRTHVEIGLPLAFIDAAGSRRSGIAGVDFAILHNLNVETHTLPALALAVDVLAPVGALAPEEAHTSVKGIVTRTLAWARFHLNGSVSLGRDASDSASSSADVSRWLAGLAIDRTFPLESLLLTAELVVRRPTRNEEHEWSAGTGLRYQLTPTLAIDAGVGKHLTGDDASWFVTFGLARAFAIRALMGARR